MRHAPAHSAGGGLRPRGAIATTDMRGVSSHGNALLAAARACSVMVFDASAGTSGASNLAAHEGRRWRRERAPSLMLLDTSAGTSGASNLVSQEGRRTRRV